MKNVSMHTSFPLLSKGGRWREQTVRRKETCEEEGNFTFFKFPDWNNILSNLFCLGLCFYFIFFFNTNYYYVLFHFRILIWIKILIKNSDRENSQTPLIFFSTKYLFFRCVVAAFKISTFDATQHSVCVKKISLIIDNSGSDWTSSSCRALSVSLMLWPRRDQKTLGKCVYYYVSLFEFWYVSR